MILSRFEPDDDEYESFKTLVICGVGLLVSLWFAWSELEYMLFSKTATATVVEADIVETTGRRGRRSQKLYVKYLFTEEDGRFRRDDDRASADYPLPDDGTVQVQYFPGDGNDSRLVGNGSQWSLFVVAAVLLYAGYSLWKLIREANAPIPTSRGPRRAKGRARR